MNAYSAGWLQPVADDVTEGELIVGRWDVERTAVMEPHPDGVIDRATGERRPGTPGDVRVMAANDVRRPLYGRTVDGSTGAWSVDPVTGLLVTIEAPSVRYAPEQGRPTGWSEQAPETSSVVLARSTSRVTRSRKGRSSFVVTGRSTHTVTVGSRDASGADFEVPPGRWTGATLAQLAEAFVRSVAIQSGDDVEPLPALIGAEDGRHKVRPLKVDRSGAVDVAESDVLVPSDGLARIGRNARTVRMVQTWDVVGHPTVASVDVDIEVDIEVDPAELSPYRLQTNEGDIHAVSWQNLHLAGIDDDAAWRAHESDGIADAYAIRRLSTRIPKRIVDATHVLADTVDARGRRRIIRGTVAPDGTVKVLAPGLNGAWWIGHDIVRPTTGRAVKAAKVAANAPKREAAAAAAQTVDVWLPLVMALGIGQVVDVDGATLARPTVERFEVRTGGTVHGGRTATAAINKARRAMARIA